MNAQALDGSEYQRRHPQEPRHVEYGILISVAIMAGVVILGLLAD